MYTSVIEPKFKGNEIISDTYRSLDLRRFFFFKNSKIQKGDGISIALSQRPPNSNTRITPHVSAKFLRARL